MSDENTSPAPKVDIDWTKTTAGALAAVTTAVLLSTLGAVGTLIGAALGSVAATVGSALYAQGLQRGRRTVVRAQELAAQRVRRPHGPSTDPDEPRAGPVETDDALDQDAEPTLGDRLRALPWKRIAVLAAATFVVVLLALTLFEKATGRSVSSYTGGSSSGQGSTLGGVSDGGNGGDDDSDKGGGGKHKGDASPSASPSASEEASGTPSDEPSETASETPTESATPTPTASSAPTPSSTPTPSATPTPTPTTAPSATPTARPSG